jgi:hypothetical protein
MSITFCPNCFGLRRAREITLVCSPRVEVNPESHILGLLAEKSAGNTVERTKHTVLGPGVGETGQVALWNEMTIPRGLLHLYCRFSQIGPSNRTRRITGSGPCWNFVTKGL